MERFRILVVDDCEAHLYAISRRLEKSGFEVETAATGRDALQIASARVPDAVLLDINLPDINGLDICSKLRANEQTNNVGIIFHTATHSNERAQLEAQSRGADAFLTYPVEPNHLETVLLGTIAKRRARAAGSRG